MRNVTCDECNTYYHTDCMVDPNSEINGANATWLCVNCIIPQFSSSLFAVKTVVVDSFSVFLIWNSQNLKY